jgi:glycosyltransferase involved in cell wall biosynthesis
MKIAILTSDLGGGTGNHLLSMLKHWDKARWETVIISTARLGARVVPDVPVQYIPPSNLIGFYPIAQIRYLSRLRQIMKDRPPDIVHAFFFWSIIYGRMLKLTGTVKTLVENREDQGFNWGRHEYAWLRWTTHLPDKIICVSEAVKQVVMEREGVGESRIAVVNNGIDLHHGSSGLQAATRRELGFDADHLILGMVANYNRMVKGVIHFLEAVPAIISAVPTARFLFLGGGHEEHSLREKARTLGVEPYVVFAGYKNDIQRYYEIIDVSVLTSFSEGFSLTLLESMAYGIPIVATQVGGNPELVIEGQTGYLVPVKNHQILVDRIVILLLNQGRRQSMGKEGRLRVEQKFQMRDVATRYLDIYKGLLAEKQ